MIWKLAQFWFWLFILFVVIACAAGFTRPSQSGIVGSVCAWTAAGITLAIGALVWYGQRRADPRPGSAPKPSSRYGVEVRQLGRSRHAQSPTQPSSEPHAEPSAAAQRRTKTVRRSVAPHEPSPQSIIDAATPDERREYIWQKNHNPATYSNRR